VDSSLIGEIKMGDFLLSLIIVIVLTVSIGFSLFSVWEATERSISKNCEKLGTFYVGDKVYKCEAVK
jgi:hypothetical protein